MTILSSHVPCRQPTSSTEWSVFNARPRVDCGFSARDSTLEVPGLSLVHLVNKSTAGAGDKLLFTAWILNSTNETLTDVNLIMRSFTNESLEQLQYDTQPSEKLLKGRVLGPRQSLQYSFTYRVLPGDIADSGLMVSALGAELTSSVRGRLISECDAIVAT